MSSVEQQIAEHEKKIQELRAEQQRLRALSPERRLAEALHELQCTWNHTDGCGWFYEVSATYPGGAWNGYAHKRYLVKAKKVIELLPNYDVDEIVTVATALRG